MKYKFNAQAIWDNQIFNRGEEHELTPAQVETWKDLDVLGKPWVEGATKLIEPAVETQS